jgi:hypothetical protein
MVILFSFRGSIARISKNPMSPIMQHIPKKCTKSLKIPPHPPLNLARIDNPPSLTQTLTPQALKPYSPTPTPQHPPIRATPNQRSAFPIYGLTANPLQ